jgi:hypothetical protein
MSTALVAAAPVLVIATLVAATFVARRRGYNLGGNTVVRLSLIQISEPTRPISIGDGGLWV